MRQARSAIAVALLLLATSAGASTLYLRRVVVGDPQTLTLGDLVQTAGSIDGAALSLLGRSAAVPRDRLLMVHASFFRSLLEDAAGGATIVGRRTLVVPRGLIGDEAVGLFDRVLDWLDGQGLFGTGAVEVEVLRGPDRTLAAATAAPEAAPRLQLLRSERTHGLLSGIAEISVQPTSGGTGRIAIRVHQSIPSQRDGVLSGETVQLFVRQGAVTVELQGRALSSAAPGQQVSVWVADSGRSFTGIAAGRKVVDVEVN